MVKKEVGERGGEGIYSLVEIKTKTEIDEVRGE
jgi:hypothetical protein